jgi:hypothetical protein
MQFFNNTTGVVKETRMIPMVPFSPFSQLGAYATEDTLAIINLHDRLLAHKKSEWQLSKLQGYVAQYLDLLKSSLEGCQQLADYKLLKRFCVCDSDLATVYLCAATISDTLLSLLSSVKTIKPRSLQRSFYYLTKQVVAAIAVYKSQIAPQIRVNLLEDTKE